MGQGVSRKGSYTPGQKDSELPIYDAENGNIRKGNKGSVKLVATSHKDDEGNAAGAAARSTPDSSFSAQDKKKEKKRRFGFSLKKNASGKRRRKLNKEVNGVRPNSCPPALRTPDDVDDDEEKDATNENRRSQGIFKQGIDDIAEESDHDQKIDTVSLSSNDEKEKIKHGVDVKVKKKKANHQKSKTPKKKKEKTSKVKSEKRKSDSVLVVSSRQYTDNELAVSTPEPEYKDNGLAASTAKPAHPERLLAETKCVTDGELSVMSLSRDTPAVTVTDDDHPTQIDAWIVRIPTDEEHKTIEDLSAAGQEQPCAVEIVECEGAAVPGLFVEAEGNSKENVEETLSFTYEGILGFPIKKMNQKDENEQSLQSSVVVGFEADENGEDWQEREGALITYPNLVGEIKQDEQQLSLPYTACDTQLVPENVTLPFITGEAKAGKIKEEQISLPFIAGEIKEHVTLPFIDAQNKEEQQITMPFIADETKEEQNMFLPFTADEVKQEPQIMTLPFVSIETKKDQNTDFLLVSGEGKQEGAMITLPFIAGEMKVEEQETAMHSVTGETEKQGPMCTLPFIAVETREKQSSLPFVVGDHKIEEPKVILPSIAMETEQEEQKISLPLVACEPRQKEPMVALPFITMETEDQNISLPFVAGEHKQEKSNVTLPFIAMETKEEEQKISLPLVACEPRQEEPRVTLPFITVETKEDKKISSPFAGGDHKQEEPKVTLPFIAMETEEEEQKISLPLVACESEQEGPRVTLPFITTETKNEKQISLPSVAGETNQEKMKMILSDVTCESKQKGKHVTVVTVEETRLSQRLEVREEKREAHKSETDIVAHTATTSHKELVDTLLQTEVAPIKLHVQADMGGQTTTELQEAQGSIMPQPTVELHSSQPEIRTQNAKEHVTEAIEASLSPAQLRAREKEMKALKKKEEKARAKAAKDEKKRLKEEKKREAKEKKVKEKEKEREKSKLLEIEVKVKVKEEAKTEMEDGLIVPLTAQEESSHLRSSAIFGKRNEVAQETFTATHTIKEESSHLPSTDSEDKLKEPVEETLTVAQTVKLEAVHMSPAIVADLEDSQGEVTRQTKEEERKVVMGPNSAVQECDTIMSLGSHDEIVSSIESSVINVDKSLQTRRKDEKPDGRPPDLPDSPYPDDDNLQAQKVDQQTDIPIDSLSDISIKESLSASWGGTDLSPYLRFSPGTKEALRSPETGEASGSPLKKIELGPRLRTAILRRSTGEMRMSEVKRVNLTKPRSVDTLSATPPSRRHRPRRPGEHASNLESRDSSSPLTRASCGATIQYHPHCLSQSCDAMAGEEETRETLPAMMSELVLPAMTIEQLATSEEEERSGEHENGNVSERRVTTTSDCGDLVGSSAGDLLSVEYFVSTLQVAVTSSVEGDGLGSQVTPAQGGTTLRPTSGQEGDLDLIQGAEDTGEERDEPHEVYVVEELSLGLNPFVSADSHVWNDADNSNAIPASEAHAQVTGGNMQAQDLELFHHLRDKKNVDRENSSDDSSDSDDAASGKGGSDGGSDSDDVAGSPKESFIAGVTAEVTECARACKDCDTVEQTADREKGEREAEKDCASVTADYVVFQTLSHSHQSEDATYHRDEGDMGLVPVTCLASDTNVAHDSGRVEESCGQASGAECCGQACGQACGPAEETRELPGKECSDVGSTCSGVSGSSLPGEDASAASSSPHGVSMHVFCLLPDMPGDTKASERLEANNNVPTSTGASIREEGD